MLTESLVLGAATFCHIGLKSVQQLNVVYHRMLWVAPTSLGLASVEVYVVSQIAVRGFGLAVVLPVAIGASLGCMTAMAVHRRARARKGL